MKPLRGELEAHNLTEVTHHRALLIAHASSEAYRVKEEVLSNIGLSLAYVLPTESIRSGANMVSNKKAVEV